MSADEVFKRANAEWDAGRRRRAFKLFAVKLLPWEKMNVVRTVRSAGEGS